MRKTAKRKPSKKAAGKGVAKSQYIGKTKVPAPLNGAEARPWIVRNMKLVAEFFRVSAHGARKWREEKGFPDKTPEGWDLSEICQWRGTRPGRRGSPEKEQADIDLKLERIRKVQLENERAEGNLVSLEEYETNFLRLCALVRSKFMSIPTTLTAQMETASSYAERLAVAEQLIAEALEVIAEDVERSLSQPEKTRKR